MVVYKIECEFDMGFSDLYETKEAANVAVLKADWEELCGMSYDDIVGDGLVSVEPVEVD